MVSELYHINCSFQGKVSFSKTIFISILLYHFFILIFVSTIYLHIFRSALKNGWARFLSGIDSSFSLSLLFIFFSLICCLNVTQKTQVKRVWGKWKKKTSIETHFQIKAMLCVVVLLQFNSVVQMKL